MNIYKTNLFPYIIGDSLKGKTVTMTMSRAVTEKVTARNQTEEKIVLYFGETDKGLILNKTNAKIIARLYGPETDKWNGGKVTLYTEEVKAFGDTHNAIRIAPAIPADKPASDEQPALVEVPEPAQAYE